MLSTSRFLTRKSTPRTHREGLGLLSGYLPGLLGEAGPNTSCSQPRPQGMETSGCWASPPLPKSHPHSRLLVFQEAFPDHQPVGLPAPLHPGQCREACVVFTSVNTSVLPAAQRCLFPSPLRKRFHYFIFMILISCPDYGCILPFNQTAGRQTAGGGRSAGCRDD